MNAKVKGSICGIIAAISYGTNPLGALPLYAQGINSSTVLFHRFTLAAVIIAAIMAVRRIPFRVSGRELSLLAVLGITFAVSSLGLFLSFHYMDAGVASTILFVYPVMVAVIMALFFKEKITISTVLSILLALGGISMLYKGNNSGALSSMGIALVMISSLSYAIYIIIVNQSKLDIPAIKLTFYVLIFCSLTIVTYSMFSEGNHMQMLTTPAMWGSAAMLALVPTVISLIMMVYAVNGIGSTATAIMGALEPLTAVIIGVCVFDEIFTFRLALGIVLILSGVLLIIAGKSLPRVITAALSIRKKR